MMRLVRPLRLFIALLVVATLIPASQITLGQAPSQWTVSSADGRGAEILAQPIDGASVLGTLPEGAQVSLHETEPGNSRWVLAEDQSGIRGFVLRDKLKRAPATLISVAPVATTVSSPQVARDSGPQQIAAGASSQRVDERSYAPLVNQPAANPKLDSQLSAANRTLQERGVSAATDDARSRGLAVTESRVRVVIETDQANRQAVESGVGSAGGTVEGQYANLVQALVPLSALNTLASRNDVKWIAPPSMGVPDAVTGEEIAASAANGWQATGVNGTGVKVGVIDFGFGGLATRQAAGDLPNTVTTQDFCNGNINVDTHGTGVAEIIHEMAPAAELHLLCVNTQVQLGQAKDYAVTNGLHVINHSGSWFNTSRGDGSGAAGTPDAIVEDARTNGILWVNSAGNRAQTHWTGTFNDSDADNRHNYSPTDEGNTFFLGSGAQVCVYMKWDSWPTTSENYDLLIGVSATNAIVASSTNVQNGAQPPTESRCYTNPSAGQNHFIAIDRIATTGAPRIDIFTTGSVLEYQNPDGSVTEPGSAPEAFAAAAICWQNNALESFSSRGPTIDGRVKPDIAGQDSVSNGTFGNFVVCGNSGFTGTSAAAPSVAGAAALAKQSNPGFNPAQLQSFLEGRAIDLGTAGKDNSFGFGKLSLGCTAVRPDLSRAVTPIAGGRLRVDLSTVGGLLTSITATKLTNAQVEVGASTLTSNGQGVGLTSTGVQIFVQRTTGGGSYTAELVLSDVCGNYPLFFGAGS